MYRTNELLQTGKKIFKASDLELIWQINKKNTLYTTLKRYVKKGWLYRLYKGLYTIVPLEKLYPLELGNALVKSFCYLSCESILARQGIIFQASSQITFVSNYSDKIVLKNHYYRVRKLADKYLYNTAGILKKTTHLEATLERAIADMLYFNPKFFFDNKKIDWKKVKNLQKKIGYL